MRRTVILGVVLISIFFISGAEGQEVRVIKFADLEEIISEKNGHSKIINFWATWCKPCIKELPQFEALGEKFKGSGLEVVLVSFDFSRDLDRRLKPFVEKKKLKSTVVLLDETDYNSFIDKVDKTWSGAIPATLMVDYRNGNKKFFEREFKEGELESTYLQFIN